MVESRWWRTFCWLLGGLLVGVVVPAQRVVWRIPAAGSVEYRRVAKAVASSLCSGRQAAKHATLNESLPARYLHGLPPAPILCDGELRDDRRALRLDVPGAVADLRDAVRALACDLSGRSASMRFRRLLPFGDVAVRGSWSAPDASGSQTMRAAVTAKAPGRLAGEPKEHCGRLLAFCVRAAAGQLHLERTVDAERGLVTGYRGEFDLVAEEGPRKFRRLRIVDEWRFVAVRENQDFDFRRRVAVAIENGANWVRAAIATDASYLADKRGERNYGSGRLALGLLAMLHGNVSAGDEVLVEGFAALRRRRIDDAYSLATALMAMAAWHRRAPLRDRDRKVCERWLARLLTCVDPRTEPTRVLRFNYEKGPRYDTSLQQYGLLGLRAAQDLDLAVPEHAFRAAVAHLLAVQAPSAGTFELCWSDHEQVRATLGTSDAPKCHRQRARLRGFAYQEPGEPPFGSMTSAGVSGLLLAREGLRRQGGKHMARSKALLKRIDQAVVDGFAWLGKNFSVRINPGYAERADNHWAYWLYCLERCCELRGVARVQGRDWYYEGGLQLLAAQRRNGSFRAGHASTLQLDSTCFAILFLAKASAPGPITGG